MDPLSAIFSAYLNTVQNTVVEGWKSGKNSDIKAVSVNFEGYQVHYRHQFWKIRETSICSRYKDIQKHSNCTVKAKKLFNQTCDRLIFKPINSRYNGSLTNMYCNAAENYKPTIARISRPKSNLPPEVREAKEACNIATVNAMGKYDQRLINDRDIKCARYKSIK